MASDRVNRHRTGPPCVDCGRPTTHKPGKAFVRCSDCHRIYISESARAWVVDSLREWDRMFGAPPSTLDWAPRATRKREYCRWKADRYEETERRWPSITAVANHFGSWNEGLRAAGFEPLDPSEYYKGHAGVAKERNLGQ